MNIHEKNRYYIYSFYFYYERNIVMKKKVILISLFFIILLIILFFCKFNYKKIKFGNNESNKSVDQIKEYILNINSYTAVLDVTTISNKNTNKYILEQSYKKGAYEEQKVNKPENIEGTTIIYKDNTLEIKNSKLNLSKIYNDYPYLSNNVLCLSSFIEDCNKNLEKINIYEQNNDIVFELSTSINAYLGKRTLYLEKGTGKPKKMVVQDDNNKDIIYILYNEIDIKN